MYKIIDLGCEFEQTGEPRARLLDTSLVKTASSAIQEYWSTLEPSSEFSYLWVIGVSAMEYYGCNNNGDAFHEADLKKTLPDWQERANIFVHHVNKDPRKGIGKPVFAWYNDEMHRVELVLAIKKSAPGASQIVTRIKAGEQMYVSMGCNVAYDVCSICGHESKTRAEYCDHLKFNMKKIIPGGKQVYAINPNPHFFDISIVTRPADPTAFALDKIASYGANAEFVKTSSAELGENVLDLMRKSASVRKMADIIKQVEGQVVDAKDDSVEAVRDLLDEGFEDFDYPEMDYDALDRIGTTPIGLLHALHSHGLPPSLDDAYWMSGIKHHGIGFGEVLHHLPRLLEILGDHPDSIEPILGEAFSDPMEDSLRHALTMKVVEPVVVKRITIIERLPRMDKYAEVFGRPDYVDTDKRNWAQMRFADQYGHQVVTTPYHIRQGQQIGGKTSGWVSNKTLGTALALAAIGSLVWAPGLSSKLIGSAVFGLPAVNMLTTSKPKYRQVNGGVEVPAETIDMAFKRRIEKTAMHGAIAPMVGMTVPALLALDYGVNKWKANRDGVEEPNDWVHRAGGWVMKHPVASAAGSALGAAILHHGTAGIWKSLVK